MVARTVLLVIAFYLQGATAPKPATQEQTRTPAALNVLFFTASWCEPCRAVHPILEKFAQKNKKEVKLVVLDFDRAKGDAAYWGVQEIPVVIVTSAQGEVLLRYEGARQNTPSALNAALEDLLNRVRKGGEKCQAAKAPEKYFWE